MKITLEGKEKELSAFLKDFQKQTEESFVFNNAYCKQPKDAAMGSNITNGSLSVDQMPKPTFKNKNIT